jgi:predicted MFS family arabinose efflux permease
VASSLGRKLAVSLTETAAVPSDRRTFASLALQSIVNAFVYSTYLARLPDIRDQAGISIGAIGVIMTVGNLAGFAGSFFTSSLVRRLGSKRVTIWCGVLYVLSLPVVGSSTSVALLVSAVVGMMLMNVFVDVGVAVQSTQFSIRRHHPVMSRMAGFYSLGTFAGGAAAAWIMSAGFDVSFHLFVLAIVLATALVFVGPGLLPVDEHPDGANRTEGSGSRWRPGPAVLALGLASAMAVPLDIVPGEWATFRMTDDLGTSHATAAAAYFMFAAGMAVGRLGGDWAIVRIGRTRVAWLGPAMSVAGLLTAAGLPSHTTAMAGFLVAGLGISVVSPLLTEMAARVPGPPGSGFRAMFVGDRLAGLLTPAAVGSLAASSQLGVGTSMIIMVLPSAALLVFFAMLSIRR